MSTVEVERKPLPAKFRWMDEMEAPKAWLEAQRHYGLLEKEQGKVVPELHDWCIEMGVNKMINRTNDFPWCGLFVGVVLTRVRWGRPNGFLAAKNWLKWGVKVKEAKWFDVVVFQRTGGGHVAFVVAENKDNYLCFGGNQANAVGLAWIAKSRCVGIRRPAYKSYVPPALKMLTFDGKVSKNEA